jgi:hypothetical protein
MQVDERTAELVQKNHDLQASHNHHLLWWRVTAFLHYHYFLSNRQGAWLVAPTVTKPP